MAKKIAELKVIRDAIESSMEGRLGDKYSSFRGLFNLVSDLVDKVEDLDNAVYRLYNPNP